MNNIELIHLQEFLWVIFLLPEASRSSRARYLMNYTLPLLPIFTAAAQLDLLECLTLWSQRTIRNPEYSRLRFSQSPKHQQSPLDLQPYVSIHILSYV